LLLEAAYKNPHRHSAAGEESPVIVSFLLKHIKTLDPLLRCWMTRKIKIRLLKPAENLVILLNFSLDVFIKITNQPINLKKKKSNSI